MEKPCSLKWSSFAINLATSLKDIRKEGDLCDVTLVSDDEVHIHAHKIILICRMIQNPLLKMMTMKF